MKQRKTQKQTLRAQRPSHRSTKTTSKEGFRRKHRCTQKHIKAGTTWAAVFLAAQCMAAPVSSAEPTLAGKQEQTTSIAERPLQQLAALPTETPEDATEDIDSAQENEHPSPLDTGIRAESLEKTQGKMTSARIPKVDILKQTQGVNTNCFPKDLQKVLINIAAHFGKPIVITSGYRKGGSRGSYHRKCMAADIQIEGVSPRKIADYARGLPDVGGVGTYGHTRSVHVDVGERVFNWHGKRRRYTNTGGSDCCPVCAARAARDQQRYGIAACSG